MIIENQVYDGNMAFGELECGDVFIYEDEICMKTNGDIETYNAVRLKDGRMVCFFADEMVRLVTASLTVK